MTKFLFIERNAKHLGGGPKCSLAIMDILKGEGNSVHYYSLKTKVPEAFSDIKESDRYYPLLNFSPEDFEEGEEAVQEDYAEAMKNPVSISDRLKTLCDSSEVIVNFADYLNPALAELYGSKLIAYLHNFPISLQAKHLKKAKRVLVNSSHTYLDLRRLSDFDNELMDKTFIVNPPVNPYFYDSSVPLKDRRNDLLFYGRIAPDKLGEFDFPLFEKFAEEKNLNMQIIGSSWASRYSLNSKSSVKTNLTFDEVKRVLSDSKIYIHTKRKEDFGQSICEALASGCIVFVPDEGWGYVDIPGTITYTNLLDLELQIQNVLEEDSLEQFERVKYARVYKIRELYERSKEAVLKYVG